MYATLLTCPHIAYATSKVARYQANPKQSYWTATKQILRYLKSTRDYGILYKGHQPTLKLLGYTDADFARDLDNRKSRTGFAYTLGSTIISWGSHCQGCTSNSTTKVELVVCDESIK